jgi:hypothetical protein
MDAPRGAFAACCAACESSACVAAHNQLSHAWSHAVVRSVATGGRAPGVGRSEAAAARFMKMTRHPNSQLRICDGVKVVLKAFVFD